MDGFYGEIRAFPYTYAPRDWAYCNGAILAVQQYQALAVVIGFRFGGDGRSTFGLPNLQTLVVGGFGQGTGLLPHPFASQVGAPSVTLGVSNLPSHTHVVNASGGKPALKTAAPTTSSAASVVVAGTVNVPSFSATATPNASFAGAAIGTYGAPAPAPIPLGLPSLAMPMCICISGEYPIPTD